MLYVLTETIYDHDDEVADGHVVGVVRAKRGLDLGLAVSEWRSEVVKIQQKGRPAMPAMPEHPRANIPCDPRWQDAPADVSAPVVQVTYFSCAIKPQVPREATSEEVAAYLAAKDEAEARMDAYSKRCEQLRGEWGAELEKWEREVRDPALRELGELVDYVAKRVGGKVKKFKVVRV